MMKSALPVPVGSGVAVSLLLFSVAATGGCVRAGFGVRGDTDSSADVALDTAGDSATDSAAENTVDSVPTEASSDSAAAPGTHLWSARLGRAGGLESMVLKNAGAGVIVAGAFRGAVDLGGGVLTAAGGTDAFLARLDGDGSHLWSKRFGGSGDDRAKAVAADAEGHVAVIGVFVGSIDLGGGPLSSHGADDVFVAVFDAGGNHLWSWSFGGAQIDTGNGVAIDQEVVVTGAFRGSIDLGGGALTAAGLTDVFLARLDLASGAHLWSQRFGGASYERGNAVDAVDGEIAIVGAFTGTTTFGGAPLVAVGGYDIYAARFDADGTHVWSEGFGSSGTDMGEAVALDSGGDLTFTGTYGAPLDFGGGVLTHVGLSDVYIARFDGGGAHRWSAGFGSAAADGMPSVAAGAAGEVTVTGRFSGSVDFGGGVLTSSGADDVVVARFAEGGGHVWSKRFGGGGHDTGTGVAVDASGRAWVAGTFEDTIDFGTGALRAAGVTNVFLARLEADGGPGWNRAFAGPASDVGAGVATNGAGDVAIVGSFDGVANLGGDNLGAAGSRDVLLARFSAAGAHLWSQRFGSTGVDTGEAVAVDGSGRIVVTGRFGGTASFGGSDLTSAGGDDVFLARYAEDGTHLWSRGLGGPEPDVGLAAAVDGSGGVVVTGYFSGTASFGGDPLTSASAAVDVFVARFSAAGAHQWSVRFGGGDVDIGHGVGVDGGGNVVVVGLFNDVIDFGGGALTAAGGSDIFVARLDPAGHHRWSKRFGDTGPDAAEGVAVDSAGGIAVTGTFSSNVDFGGGGISATGGQDVFVARLDATGDHVWSRGFGGAGEDTGYGVAVADSGAVTVTGAFNGEVDFGGGVLTSAGSRDIFVASFSAAGDHLWSQACGGTRSDVATAVALRPAGGAVITGQLDGLVDFGGGALVGVSATFLAAFGP